MLLENFASINFRKSLKINFKKKNFFIYNIETYIDHSWLGLSIF